MSKMTEKQPIKAALHCRQCINSKPRHIAPKDWARLEVTLTDKGHVQVWCLRHDIHVYLSARPTEDITPVCELCEAGTPHPTH